MDDAAQPPAMWRLVVAELVRLRRSGAVLLLLTLAPLVSGTILAADAWATRRPADPASETVLGSVRVYHEGSGTGQDGFILDPVLTPAHALEGSGTAVVVVLLLLAALAGLASARHGRAGDRPGSEAGPRRLWTATALAVTLGSGLVAAAVLTAYWAVVGVLVGARDVPVEPGAWADAVAFQARALVLVGLAALLAHALATLARSTVAALAVLLGAAVLGTYVPLTLLGSDAHPWLLPSNAAAFLWDGFRYPDHPAGPDRVVAGSQSDWYVCEGPFGCGSDGLLELGLPHGAAYLGCLTAVLVAGSLWSLRRRDVP